MVVMVLAVLLLLLLLLSHPEPVWLTVDTEGGTRAVRDVEGLKSRRAAHRLDCGSCACACAWVCVCVCVCVGVSTHGSGRR